MSISSRVGSSTFRFDSIVRGDEWVIGAQIPILGESILKINGLSGEGYIQALYRILGTSKISLERKSLAEINHLLFKFFRFAQRDDLRSNIIRGKNFSILFTIKNTNNAMRRVNRYLVEIVHNGLLIDTSLIKLNFNFLGCNA